MLLPLGERTFFDRNHGGTVRFERDGGDDPWTPVYRPGDGLWSAPGVR